MIIGHFFLAFALTAIIGKYLEIEDQRLIKLGFLAALIALIPDVDIVFAFSEILTLGSGFYEFTDSFWTASEATHRGLTHSLVILGAVSSGLITYHRTGSKLFASVLLTGFTAAALTQGLFSAATMAMFIALGLLLTEKIGRNFTPREFALVLFTGLIIHPFGDVFTGTPPEFLYPLGLSLMESRIILNTDPVINLLAILLIELSTALLAIKKYSDLKGLKIWDELRYIPLLGVFFVIPGLFIREPTMSTSYQMVGGLIVFAAAAVFLVRLLDGRDNRFALAVNIAVTSVISTISYLAYYMI